MKECCGSFQVAFSWRRGRCSVNRQLSVAIPREVAGQVGRGALVLGSPDVGGAFVDQGDQPADLLSDLIFFGSGIVHEPAKQWVKPR